MTDKAVSALTSLTGSGTATGDLLYIVDISEASAADRSKKITAQELQNYIKGFPATIGVGGATPAASGAGISFPATISASSDANTLDDYEEGTPASLLIAGSTSAGTGTYINSTPQVKYIKIGRFVFVAGYLAWSAHTGTGNMLIAGFPFISANTSGFHQPVVFGYFQNISLAAGNIATAYFDVGSTAANVVQYPTGGGTTTTVPLDSAGELIFSAAYITD